jgi:hypothetical protein
MTQINSETSSNRNGFSSCKFKDLFSHVEILYPNATSHSISPKVTLTDKAFDFILCRFIPLHAKYDLCIVKCNEISKYFFMYEFLSTIALYGYKFKNNVRIKCDNEDSANIYHEYNLSSLNACKGPLEFVTKSQDETKITSVTEVKKVISSNFSEVVVGGKMYQFFAQLSVAVEKNRLNNCWDDVWGSFTDGNIWIFACATSDKNKNDLTSGIKIHVAEPLVFRLNQSATSDTKTVFEYLFSSLYSQMIHK